MAYRRISPSPFAIKCDMDTMRCQAITHVMEPVLPGYLAILTVGGATLETRIYGFRLPNQPTLFPGDGEPEAAGPGMEWMIVQRWNECLTVDVPPGPHAALALSLSPEFNPARSVIVNRPRLDWTYPSCATPGKSFRLIGRNMVSAEHYPTSDSENPVSYGGFLEARTRIVACIEGATDFIEIPVIQSSGYEAWLNIPQAIERGHYRLYAHNGLGGPLGWSEPLGIEIAPADPWPDTIVRVDAFGGTDPSADGAIAAAIERIREQRGGILEFSARVYEIHETIVLPPRTILRGAGGERTVFKLPSKGSPQQPYVVITGDADFVVEDIRIEAVFAPILICAPTFLPATFEDALRIPFTWSPVRARNVTVQRCHLVQRMLQQFDRYLDKEYVRAVQEYVLKQKYGAFGGFKGIHLRGDNLAVLDTTVYGGGSGAILPGCRWVRVANSTLKAGPSGHALNCLGGLTWPEGHPKNSFGAKVSGNYCSNILIEDNDISAYSERAADLLYFSYGAEKAHVARNRIHDIEQTWDGEGLGCHLWSARWMDPTIRMHSPTTGEIIDPGAEVEHECLEDAIIDVVAGRGVGQIRRIVRREGNWIEIDRPWSVDPDVTSRIVFTAPPPFHRMTFIDNDIFNTGINIICWGLTNDIVIDGNHSSDDPYGITVWSVRLAANQKVWGGAAFSSIINNRVDQRSGIATLGTKFNDCTAEGYDILGLIIRNNFLSNHSSISVRTTFPQYGNAERWRMNHGGIVVEGNFIKDGTKGITLEKGAMLVERRNFFENVHQPLIPDYSPLCGE